MAAFSLQIYCVPHDFAWLAPQELRDDQIIGPGIDSATGSTVAVDLQAQLVQMRLEVASVERLMV